MRYMWKMIPALVLLLMVLNTAVCACVSQQIGEAGDRAWSDLLEGYGASREVLDSMPAAKIVAGFETYQHRIMRFPGFDFSRFVTDKFNQKYYYHGERSLFDFVVIKNNEAINDKLRKLSSVVGPLGDQGWEVLGEIEEAYTWWGNVVLMSMVAMRVPGKACVIVDNGEVRLVGETLMEDFLSRRENEAGVGIPMNLANVPQGLAPVVVAKLFFHTSSVEKNRDVWDHLLTADARNARRADSWWRNLTTMDRQYIFIRENQARSTDSEKMYLFQIKKDGKALGNPKPVKVVKEDGEWKVQSATP